MEHIRPHFDRPPLVEQAVVVVFEPILGFSIVDYGLFWTEIREEFPEISSSDPSPEQTENFDHFAPARNSIELIQSLPLPRGLFRDASGSQLVHIQPNQFGFNWSKVGDAPYPRSEQVMSQFNKLFARFSTFVESRELGPPQLKQCELTNLNIVPVREFGESYEDMTAAFQVDPLDLKLPFLKAETYNRTRQHLIIGNDGEPAGRLHTVITPVISRQDGAMAFRLELTARSRPKISSIEAMREFFTLARTAINGAFCATVTPEMKDWWGERRA